MEKWVYTTLLPFAGGIARRAGFLAADCAADNRYRRVGAADVVQIYGDEKNSFY